MSVMMSDWLATYDAVGAANGGLDIEMPTGKMMNRKNLLPAVGDGKVSQATIDEKVRRILKTAIRFGWLDHPATDISLSTYNEQNQQLALLAAREGTVLLKNEKGLLPLDQQRSKQCWWFGPNAYPGEPVGGGSARVNPFTSVSALQGISSYLGSSATVYYEAGLPDVAEAAGETEFVTEAKDGKRGLKLETFQNDSVSGTPDSSKTVLHLNDAGTSWGNVALDPESLEALFNSTPQPTSKRWSGYYVAGEAGLYEIVAQGSGEGAGYRLYVDDKLLFDDWKLAKALQEGTVLRLTAGTHKIVGEAYLNSTVRRWLALEFSNKTKLLRTRRENWQQKRMW